MDGGYGAEFVAKMAAISYRNNKGSRRRGAELRREKLKSDPREGNGNSGSLTAKARFRDDIADVVWKVRAPAETLTAEMRGTLRKAAEKKLETPLQNQLQVPHGKLLRRGFGMTNPSGKTPAERGRCHMENSKIGDNDQPEDKNTHGAFFCQAKNAPAYFAGNHGRYESKTGDC